MAGNGVSAGESLAPGWLAGCEGRVSAGFFGGVVALLMVAAFPAGWQQWDLLVIAVFLPCEHCPFDGAGGASSADIARHCRGGIAGCRALLSHPSLTAVSSGHAQRRSRLDRERAIMKFPQG